MLPVHDRCWLANQSHPRWSPSHRPNPALHIVVGLGFIRCRCQNGEIRLTVGYQRLNAVKPAAGLPLPGIDSIIDVFSNGPRFSTFDAQPGYHHVVTDPRSIELTAFRMLSGLY